MSTRQKVWMCLTVTAFVLFLFVSAVPTVEAQKLVFWTCSLSQEVHNIWKENIRTFQEANPGLEIEMVTFPWEQFRAKLILSIAAGTPPDIMIIDGPWLPEFAEIRAIDPAPTYVTEDVKNNFWPAVYHYTSYKGVHYGYHELGVIEPIWYNKDAFREVGLDTELKNFPRTYQEFASVAKKLTKYDPKTDKIIRAGALLRKRIHGLNFWIYNLGGSVFHADDMSNIIEPEQCLLNHPSTLPAWRFMYNAYHVDRWASAEWGCAPFPKQKEAFALGYVTMATMPSPVIQYMNELAPDVDFGFAPLPTEIEEGPVYVTGGLMWSVSNTSKNKESAWEFVKFVNSGENLVERCNSWIWPVPRYSHMYDKQLKPMLLEYTKIMEEAGVNRPRTKTTHWGEFVKLVEPIIERMQIGELGPEEAANLATEMTNELVGYTGGGLEYPWPES